MQRLERRISELERRAGDGSNERATVIALVGVGVCDGRPTGENKLGAMLVVGGHSANFGRENNETLPDFLKRAGVIYESIHGSLPEWWFHCGENGHAEV